MVNDVKKWAESLLQDFFKNESDNQDQKIQKIFGNINEFEKKFKEVFNNFNKKRTVE